MISTHQSPLWVITSYYNPQGYQRRLRNFLAFRKNLNLPLIVVELAKEGQHQLHKTSAEVIIRLTGDSFIWQKERLLNIAIENLAAHVKYAAWVDCDVIFERDDWANEAIVKLEEHGGLLQLFDKVTHCPQDFDPLADPISSLKNRHLLAENASAKLAAQEDYAVANSRLEREHFNTRDDFSVEITRAPGHAWAASVSDLVKAKIYDGNIIGGGDSVLFNCSMDSIEDYVNLRGYSEQHKAHIFCWQKQAREHGLFRHVDFLDGNLYHYWHGDFKNRFYKQRNDHLRLCQYDPMTDLRLASNGTWTWANPEGELAQGVRRYFLSRLEDDVQNKPAGDASFRDFPDR